MHEILAQPLKRRLFPLHLEPQAPKRVIYQELHNISRGEELVAHGQFAAVARRLTLVAHFLALFAAIEELVDPSDCLILAPKSRQIRSIENGQQSIECL